MFVNKKKLSKQLIVCFLFRKFYFVTRKESIRKLAKIHCDNIRKEKLNAYKAELKAQQKKFFKQKVEKLTFIRNEEISCGLTPSIDIQQIESAKEFAEKCN